MMNKLMNFKKFEDSQYPEYHKMDDRDKTIVDSGERESSLEKRGEKDNLLFKVKQFTGEQNIDNLKAAKRQLVASSVEMDKWGAKKLATYKNLLKQLDD